ncbi:hypothetical protein [Bacillus marasmi]|uniref:hypothetical protein n=1 Tax=Bacillus marasmi TaxID=1926279 RepID=UPI001C9BC231|nr:hypothetical protein [Bacillus marasmi]
MMGIDAISDEKLIIHRKLFAQSDIVVIENLKILGSVGADIFTFCAFPIKFENANGAPVRAVAIL